MFQRSMQANRNIYLWRRFSGYPAVKHTKHSKFAITDIREKPVDFSCRTTRASTLGSAITLLPQVPLENFPFLFIVIIPWYKGQYISEFSVHYRLFWATLISVNWEAFKKVYTVFILVGIKTMFRLVLFILHDTTVLKFIKNFTCLFSTTDQ